MWFGNAAKEKDRKMKFINYVMALETILVPDSKAPKNEIIAIRFASIVFANGASEKTKAYLKMRELYRIRSSIIHSGEGYVYDEELERLYVWTKLLIQLLLERHADFENLQEMLSKEFPIDKTFFECPSAL
jgi:hypothetical protein